MLSVNRKFQVSFQDFRSSEVKKTRGRLTTGICLPLLEVSS